MVGKLRVRLSCLRPNAALSADLPLLGERAKGAHKVGSVALTLQASYASTVRRSAGRAALPACWEDWQSACACSEA